MTKQIDDKQLEQVAGGYAYDAFGRLWGDFDDDGELDAVSPQPPERPNFTTGTMDEIGL